MLDNKNLLSAALQEAEKPLNINIEYDDQHDKDVVLVDLMNLASAPDQWNVFKTWTKAEMIENMYSIQKNGLINPIIITVLSDEYKEYYSTEELEKIKDKQYIILSGHNRVKAYFNILEEAENEQEKNKYTKIQAIILNDLDVKSAIDIIIDSNLKGRKSISKQEQLAASKLTLKSLKSQKNADGYTIKQTLEKKKLSKSKLYEDITILEKVSSSILNFYYNGSLNKKSMLKIAQFDTNTQKVIYKQIKVLLSKKSNKEINFNISKLNTDMNTDEIQCTLEGIDIIKTVTKYVVIPEDLQDSFEALLLSWKQENNLL